VIANDRVVRIILLIVAVVVILGLVLGSITSPF